LIGVYVIGGLFTLVLGLLIEDVFEAVDLGIELV